MKHLYRDHTYNIRHNVNSLYQRLFDSGKKGRAINNNSILLLISAKTKALCNQHLKDYLLSFYVSSGCQVFLFLLWCFDENLLLDCWLLKWTHSLMLVGPAYIHSFPTAPIITFWQCTCAKDSFQYCHTWPSKVSYFPWCQLSSILSFNRMVISFNTRCQYILYLVVSCFSLLFL